LWPTFTWHLVPHIAYQQLTYPVTGISYQYQDYRKQACNSHVTGIQRYACNNKPRNRNIDPCNGNTRTIKACIQINLCDKYMPQPYKVLM